MTDQQTPTATTPWHLWLVGILALLWNGFGCVDYVMSATRPETWLAQMGLNEAQIAYFNAMPAWATAAWAFGVFGGLVGALFLLMRQRWAMHAFAVSQLGWVAGMIHAYGLSDGMEVMGDAWPMQLVIGAICVFLVWYGWAMAKRGVLR